MWVVVDKSTTHRMRLFNTSFAYLFWLANNKKKKKKKGANIQSSVWATVTRLGMWVVVGISITHVYLSLPNVHIWYLICISVIKRQISRPLLDTLPKAAHTVYSVNIASA